MTDQTAETVTQQNQETVIKQKNPLRTEQGRRLVEHNRRKKEELKRFNERITKQDGIEHKPRTDTNNYVYVGSLSLFGLVISGYLLYSKFKKPEQTLIDVPTPPMLNTKYMLNTKEEIFFKCSKNFYPITYHG